MAEAMAEVRHELGDDAIIVSTKRAAGGQGVRITASIEEIATDDDVHLALSGSLPSPVADQVREHLVYHGLPPRLIERMVAVARTVGSEDPTMACAGALDQLFAFAPLPERQAPNPFVMIGPPGSGKTIAVAKLAARGRLNGRSVGVISADTVRAGALEQLSAFTKILNVDLRKARGGRALTQLLHEEQGQHDLVFIDTPGLNPFYPSDMDYLRDLISGIEVEPVLVMAAGGNPVEAAEMAEAFSEIGASRLLATRLDMTRRLGAILAAADAAQFMFCDVSINPHIVNGLCPINPVSMARLLVPPEENEAQQDDDFSDEALESMEYAPSDVGEWPSGADSGYGLEYSEKNPEFAPEDRPTFSIFDDFDPDGENPNWIDRTNEVRS
jgi:flagellar biosynthesis protein FlhF